MIDLLKNYTLFVLVIVMLFITSCNNEPPLTETNNMVTKKGSVEKLLRLSYTSVIANKERDYFVYLPRGYEDNPDKKWPIIMFLHGNGERGDGKGELDYVLSHGPLYEAWIYKKNLPFIIISPQLHMFDMDKRGISYIDDRTKDWIPKRLENGVPERPELFTTDERMTGSAEIRDMSEKERGLPEGWDLVEKDLLGMIKTVQKTYRTDVRRLYLTGLSYGGFGSWYMANKHPKMFAAVVPVVGWGHPDLMVPIAQHKIPLWVFAGGRDSSVRAQYFYAGLNKLEELGHTSVQFTTHEDMAHDAWRRVYAGDDVYNWMLKHQL